MTSHNLNNRYLWEAIFNEKVCYSYHHFICRYSKLCRHQSRCFSSSNLGAAFVLSNVMSDEKNDKNGSGITVIDGNREDIKFSFKIAEIIKSLFR